jgi:hypothetical protein
MKEINPLFKNELLNFFRPFWRLVMYMGVFFVLSILFSVISNALSMLEYKIFPDYTF